jgi:hypothetical protein
MKTAGNENPNSRTRLHINPSTWSGSSEPSMLIQSGWKAGKVPAAGEVFFLTFPFIERNIKGRFFGVGFECSPQAYRKERPVC